MKKNRKIRKNIFNSFMITTTLVLITGCSSITTNRNFVEKAKLEDIQGVVSAEGVVESISQREIYLDSESKISSISKSLYEYVRTGEELFYYDGDKRLTSPISGVITEINVTKGQVVAPTLPIMKIVDADNIDVELKIHEKDIGIVQKDQIVYISTNPIVDIEQIKKDLEVNVNNADTKGEEVVKPPSLKGIVSGVVKSISPVAVRKKTLSGENVYFIARIGLNETKNFMKAGVSVYGLIQTEKRIDTITVSHKALKQVGNKTYVFIYKSGTVEEREVEIGIKSKSKVEIIQGVSADDVILLYPDSQTIDGGKISSPKLIEN